MRRSAARVPYLRGRRVAWAMEAPSRDALRGILQGDAKRTLDCATLAPSDGHTKEAALKPVAALSADRVSAF